jgi:hypothetical protein
VQESITPEEDHLITGMLFDSVASFEADLAAKSLHSRATEIRGQIKAKRFEMDKRILFPNPFILFEYFQPVRLIRARYYERQADMALAESAAMVIVRNEKDVELKCIQAVLVATEIIQRPAQD